jgi:hypothetical protein
MQRRGFITLLGASADGHLREDVGGKAGGPIRLGPRPRDVVIRQF